MINSSLTTLDGDIFANALVSGIHAVIGQQEYLNRINVFPVADSDTGTNLSLSLGSALAVLDNDGEKHLGTMLAATADVLLDGSRGNSGAIIAQFFQGMSDSAGQITKFTTYTFSKAVQLGSEYAHDALSNPRDGTILSAISAFADSASHFANATPEAPFAEILERAQTAVEAAVEHTPDQLDVLRKAGVVDAGAKGFAELVGGMVTYLRTGSIIPLPENGVVESIEPPVTFSAADNTSQYRFCTECLVTGDDIDRRKLREALADLGDSLVIAGSKRKAKVHIHVDKPERVFTAAGAFGDVAGEKADDMHRQQHSTHNTSRSFAVISDSGADIHDDDMERLDIHMVPCRIQFGDRGYLDKVSISTEEFYDALATNPHHPTTSQPAPGDFRRHFQYLGSHFKDVVSVNLTSRASGTYEGAAAVARRTETAGSIHVVDSLNASMGQGLLTILAAECANAGIGVEDALRIVRDQVPKTRTFALLKDLRFAVRGGRLPRWVKSVAEWLRLTPIIAVKASGQVALDGFLFGRKRQLQRYADHVVAKIDATGPLDVGIGHAVSADEAATLADLVRERIPEIRSLKICPLGTALGVHGGPGTLIISTTPALDVEQLAREARDRALQ